MTNWDHAEKHAATKDKRGGWPEGVHGISLEGLDLLGIHEKTRALYWDGKQIVLRNVFALTTFERTIAVIGLLIAGGSLLLRNEPAQFHPPL
jgi:hypothetical protein